MSSRALSFGSVARAYERFRPGYPDALVDQVLTYAGRPVVTALEIGAGTGKATRAFASRGIDLTASEPDPAMLAELRAQVPGVDTVHATFEDLPVTTAYDLVYAAAALHWTRPEGRWERLGALIVPGGTFASFGGPRDLADPDVEDAVREARAPWLADDDVPPPDGTAPGSAVQWPGTELSGSELFTDVRQVVVERQETVRRSDYVGLLSTVSAYLQLTPSDRRAALAAIHDVLPEHVEVAGDIIVHLAKRV